MRRGYVEYVDGQTLSLEEPPYRAVFLAMSLLLVGTTLLTIGSMVVTGHIDAKRWWGPEAAQGQGVGLVALGVVTFLPGSYVTFIAWMAYRGAPGYSFSMIPRVGDHED